MGSSASIPAVDTARPGCSLWDSQNMMEPIGDCPRGTMFVVEDSLDYQTPKESLSELAVQVEVAASKARQAVTECGNIEAYAEESVKVAGKRSAVNKKKAKKCNSLSEAQHHRTTADNLSSAAQLTARRNKNFARSLRYAKTGVKLAFLHALDIFRDLEKNEVRIIHQEQFKRLAQTKENADFRTIRLKQDEYLVLKAMRICWERRLPPSESEALREGGADLTTPLIPRDQTNNGPRERIHMILAVISFIAGCILIILSVTLSLNKSSFIAMLTAVALCAIWPLGYLICKIKQKRDAETKLAYLNRRNTMLKFIDERLAELIKFFRTRNMPLPSD